MTRNYLRANMPHGNKPTREEARRARAGAKRRWVMGRAMAATIDTLQRVLPFVLANSPPEQQALCLMTCKTWMEVMEAQGVCRRTLPLCAALAKDTKNGRKRLTMSSTVVKNLSFKNLSWASRMAFPLDATAFLQSWWGTSSDPINPSGGTLHEWLQAASQEPDASFLSRGAVRTALALGLPLVHWIGKPQRRFTSAFYELPSHSSRVSAVAISPNGKRIVTGSTDGRLKIWDAATGVEVSSFAGLR